MLIGAAAEAPRGKRSHAVRALVTEGHGVGAEVPHRSGRVYR